MTTPVWQTPAGFLGTATERTTTTFVLSVDTTATFKVISGDLPAGLAISTLTGTISGLPNSIGGTITNQFVVRAANASGVTDRTFIIDTTGQTGLSWVTPTGFIQAGIGNEYYVINKNFVDFNFEANTGQVTATIKTSSLANVSKLFFSTLTNVDIGQPGIWRTVGGTGIQTGTTITNISKTLSANGYEIGISLPTNDFVSTSLPIILYDPLPFGQQIRFWIEDGDGEIPPGLTLDESGHLYGKVDDNLGVDLRISSGGYDTDAYSGYPYDHAGVLYNGTYTVVVTKFIPKIYQFKLTTSDGTLNLKRDFKMLIVDPSNLLSDGDYTWASGPLAAESGYIVRPTWLTYNWLGFTNTQDIVL
jgi:hypothetical protein